MKSKPALANSSTICFSWLRMAASISGNSSGDYSMFRYTLKDNPYKAEVFNVLCDDTQREYGRPERAERDKKTSAENGWNTISMKNDWKTIYGDNVKKTQ